MPHRASSSQENQMPSLSPADALHETFISALLLKSQLTLCQRRFKLVFFYPDTPFDPTTMHKDSSGLDDYNTSRRHKRPQITPEADIDVDIDLSDDHHVVRLCLFPALYQSPLPKIPSDHSIGGDVESWLLDYRKFATNDKLDGYSLVARAVVLV